MAKTLIGIVDKPVDAQRLIDELTTSCHCDRSDIGLMMREVKAVGPLGASFLNASFSTAAAFTRALAQAGFSEADARCAIEAIERGGVVITVQAQTDNIARCAEGVLRE